jgi:hypothetical protein
MCGFLSSQDDEFNEGKREENKIIGFWKAVVKITGRKRRGAPKRNK